MGITVKDKLRTFWKSVLAGLGLIAGLLPHLLHHVGFLAGTALVAGSGGTVLFGALGLLFSVPMLLRIYRRFGTWRAPAIALAIFGAMFALSTLVIGPAISGNGAAEPSNVVDHNSHH